MKKVPFTSFSFVTAIPQILDFFRSSCWVKNLNKFPIKITDKIGIINWNKSDGGKQRILWFPWQILMSDSVASCRRWNYRMETPRDWSIFSRNNNLTFQFPQQHLWLPHTSKHRTRTMNGGTRFDKGAKCRQRRRCISRIGNFFTFIYIFLY